MDQGINRENALNFNSQIHDHSSSKLKTKTTVINNDLVSSLITFQSMSLDVNLEFLMLTLIPFSKLIQRHIRNPVDYDGALLQK